jgi:hypothetical protein
VEVGFRGALHRAAPGRPDLPSVVERVELPAGMRIRAASAAEIEFEPAGGARHVPAAWKPVAGGGAVRSRPDADAYAALSFLPERPVEVGYQGSLRGRRLAWLVVSPVRWSPATGRLERVRRLRVRLELEPDPRETVVRERIVPEWEEGAAAASASAPPPSGGAQPFRPTQLPSVLGSPVAYVIVTSDALAAEFQRLADWKTQTGVPAVVRTMAFVRENYPEGADDADRVRRFVRDAYARWGTRWVLLGGDTDVVPTRIVYSRFCIQADCDPPPLNDIASDLYFSCLDGNWNADGDALFGEATTYEGVKQDECDLLPEVWVGRAPASTVEEAARFVDKTLQYARTPAGDYEHRTLFFAEVLFPQDWSPGQSTTLDGAELAEACLPYLSANPARRYARLYENHLNPLWEPGALLETKAAVLDSLNAGYNLAVHVGHGFRNVMSCADANLTNADALGLANGTRLSNLYATNCTSNAIDFPCIGEALMKAENGGAVTNVGSTRVEFPAVGRYFQEEFFRLVFEDSVSAVGHAQGAQKLPFVGTAEYDNAYRWTILSMLLLGDPELRLWTGTPRTLAVTHPSSLALGAAGFSVNVSSGGAAVAGARVTALKPGDEYRVVTTDDAGNAFVSFRPDSLGPVTLTVTAYDARPYQGTLTVTSTSLPLLVEGAPVLDDDDLGGTAGNGNQKLEAGEIVDLRVPVINRGGAAANGVTGVLATSDPQVTVLTDTNAYGDVPAGGSSSGSGWFRVTTPATLEDQREIPFTLTLTDQVDRTWSETFRLTLRAPEPRHLSHRVVELTGDGDRRPEAGETVDYLVTLRNAGTGVADGVTAVLRSPDGQATIVDSTAAFGTILPGAAAEGDAFRFTVEGPAVLELVIANRFGWLATERVDLTWPSPVSGLVARGSASSVELAWTQVPDPDLLGYRVYRAAAPEGPYAPVKPVASDRTAYFRDDGLAALTQYWYRVSAVDSSANESDLSPAVAATTNPPFHPGFPIEMKSGANTPSSVAVARIYQPGRMDLLAGGDVLYCWHADGTSPVDADQSSTTSGDFTTEGRYYAAGASVGDLDGAALEIVAPTWDTKSLYVFDTQGQVKPGFPVATPYAIWSLAALGDLDGDGTKEIAFATNGPAFYLLRSDGSEWMDGDADAATSGVFKSLAGSHNYGTPAIVDLDGDGEKDIVFASFDGVLHAWRPDGSNLPGFPQTLGGAIAGSVAVGHLDGPGDGSLEIVIGSGGGDDSLYVFSATGARRPAFPVPLMLSGGFGKHPSPALADLDGDGRLDIVAAGTDGRLYAWNGSGVLLPGFADVRFSSLTEAATESSPVVADIDGDGSPDIVIGSDDATLAAFGAEGQPLRGFPIRINAEIRGTPALCDCDGDGLTEIVLAGWDSRLYMWDYDFPFSPGQPPPWPQFHHDAMRTGHASADNLLAGPPPAAVERLRFAAPAPNPARLATRVAWDVPPALAEAPLAISVLDVAGRRVRRLVEGRARQGRFSTTWDLQGAAGSRVPAGLYLLELRLGAERRHRRVVVLP